MTCETTLLKFFKIIVLKSTLMALQPRFFNIEFCKITNSFLHILSWTSAARRSSRPPKLDRGPKLQCRNNCQYGNQT